MSPSTPRPRSFTAARLGAAILSTLIATASGAQANTSPINDPDRFAWELFVEANRPAAAPNLVSWQTWISTFTLYADPCSKPQWPASPQSVPLSPSGLETIIHNHLVSGSSPFNSSEREQVMLNRAAFDYIVDQEIWFAEGVQARAVRSEIDFPSDAVMLKSNWRVINEDEKARYHWQHVTMPDGNGGNEVVLVGLNAFHIISKVLPNWLWSTFEHIDNPGRCDTIGCKDQFGATPAYVAPHREPDRLYAADSLTPELINLMAAADLAPVWQNYRLKGTMTTFTDAIGRPNLLGNSVLEPNFEATSSCMTCHTRASVSNNTTVSSQVPGASTGLSVLASFTPLQGHVGTPDPAWFETAQAGPPARAASIVWRTDFLWQLTKLRSRTAGCASDGAE